MSSYGASSFMTLIKARRTPVITNLNGRSRNPNPMHTKPNHTDPPPNQRNSSSHSAGEIEAENNDCGESTEEHEDNGEPPGQPEWKALFYFTTRRHIWVLLAGITFSITAGLVVPVQAFLLGKVFNLFVQFGAGQLSGEQLIKQVSKWCSWLAGLASASWCYHAGEYFAWLTFGELQGKHARERLFRNLLEKDIEWYDMRKSGVGALFPRLQM